MAEEKTRRNLKEIVSAAKKGVIYFDHYDKWQGFKKEWSQGDKAFWESILSKMGKDANGKIGLMQPLSSKEMAFVRDILRRAGEKELC